MKNIRKIISLLLVTIIMISVGVISPVYAKEVDNIQSVGATSGTTGYCTWTYDSSTYTLTILGNGKMGYYYSPSDVPWYSYRESIKTVKINSGVTSIGDKAFCDCTSLTSITIPDSVTSIDYYAFHHCTSLTSITIPDSVTSIGEEAFYNCTSLTSITIPDSVTSIGDRAFEYCTSLTSITIPGNLTSIGEEAFYNCTRLTSITIPDSVTSIGDSAFYKCTRLTSITIPDSVISIDKYAFAYCYSLTSITIPDSVTSIGRYAFSDCKSLTKINVDGNNKNFSSLDGNLYNKDKTEFIQYAIGKTNTSFVIPDSVISIGSGAFSGCTNLTSITIPNSVTSIGGSAFYDCTSLKVYYKGTPSQWNSISIGSGNDPLKNANIFCEYTKISLNKTSVTMYAGDYITVKPTITNKEGNTTYKSSNTGVAKVDSTGKVTAIKAGSAKITVTNNGVSASMTVTVKTFALKKTTVTLNKGKIYKVGVKDKVGTLKYTTSNKKVATVTSGGEIKAVGKGTATITVTSVGQSKNQKKTLKVTVKQPVTKIEIYYKNKKVTGLTGTMNKGKTVDFKAVCTPSNANNKAVTWKTSNSKIATITQSGKMKAKAVGKVVITAKAKDGSGKTAKFIIKIK